MRNITLFIVTICLCACCTTQKPMVGAYGNQSKLTSEEKEMFENTLNKFDSSLNLIPKNVSRQVVAGTNYRFSCKDHTGKTYKVIIFKPLPGRGEPEVTSVEQE